MRAEILQASFRPDFPAPMFLPVPSSWAFWFSLIAALLLLSARSALGQSAPPLRRAVPLDGEAFPARVERIEADWTIHLKTADVAACRSRPRTWSGGAITPTRFA